MEKDGGRWRKMEEDEEREVILEDGERWRKMEEDEEREDKDGGMGEGGRGEGEG
jgi:hypothetical protein